VTVRIRGTVESMNYSACGLRVGDRFEVSDGKLSLPAGQSFCFYALASIVPLLSGHLGRDDAWLASQPLVACPDPPEALYIRLEQFPAEGTES
jgi:uncharacterized repeat protein (TIGR04076 family)